ncbi:MAG: bifunctional phosphoglucose/phosphomannose isomerase [Bacteroidota bacterium]
MDTYQLIKDFPKQLEEAITLGRQAVLTPAQYPLHHVVISGMGGSGIGGKLLRQWVADRLPIPLAVNQDYTLPAYVSQHTLLILVSYSGNTEETLHALQEGLRRQAKIVCVTTGGTLRAMAEQHGLDLITLPSGMPPRACLGYSVVPQWWVLQFHQLISIDFVASLQSAIQLLHTTQAAVQPEARRIARQLHGKIPVIYTTTAYEAVAIRWRQQFNENSQQLCWHHIIPEMNHNELAGWDVLQQDLAVLMLHGGTSHERTALQQRSTQSLIQPKVRAYIPLQAQGNILLVQSLYLIHLGDWISYYLAQEKGVDPTAIAMIDRLKGSL